LKIIDFANSALDVYNAALETVNHIGSVVMKNSNVLNVRAKIKKGLGAAWEPVYLSISVVQLADRTRLLAVSEQIQVANLPDQREEALNVFMDYMQRRKDLTILD
jgi:hypothetical protein